jgi:hypothetical protein
MKYTMPQEQQAKLRDPHRVTQVMISHRLSPPVVRASRGLSYVAKRNWTRQQFWLHLFRWIFLRYSGRSWFTVCGDWNLRLRRTALVIFDTFVSGHKLYTYMPE